MPDPSPPLDPPAAASRRAAGSWGRVVALGAAAAGVATALHHALPGLAGLALGLAANATVVAGAVWYGARRRAPHRRPAEIAHDFNNLLGAIHGFARFIVEDAAPGDAAAVHARRVLDAAAHGKALVADILALAPGPQTPPPAIRPPAPPPPAPTPAPTPPAPPTARVLLVDDDLDFGDMLLHALERRGYEVTPCDDPREALAAFRETPDLWDVVVADHTMPHLSGVALIQAVKALRPAQPCLLCSGAAATLDRVAIHAAGVTALVPKPVDLAAFLATVERAVGGGNR